MSRDTSLLLDIRRAAGLVQDFVEGLDRGAFENDVKTQSAVLHQIMVLGEAANRLSETFRASHPQFPWRLIIGMRSRLIHGYDDVDLDEVWVTATREVPALELEISRLAADPP